MSGSSSFGKRRLVFTCAFLIGLLILLHPGLQRANPPPTQILITEFVTQPDSLERIELLLRYMPFFTDCVIETEAGIYEIDPGVAFPDSGYVVLSDSNLVGDLRMGDDGGYIRVHDSYFLYAEVSYGVNPDPAVPSPVKGQSASAAFHLDEHDWFEIDYYYLDNSPTLGAENDTDGAMGTLRGAVTDSLEGTPVDGAVITTLDGGYATSDSAGLYSLEVVSGFPTVFVTAMGYRPDTSGVREITLFPDSTVVHDVQLGRSSGILDAGAGSHPVSRAFYLYQNYPNPFNPSTSIHFEIGETGDREERTSLVIFDTRGRRVRTLVDDVRSAGRYTVYWDGKNENGLKVGSGIYLYRLQVGSFQSTRRMVILK